MGKPILTEEFLSLYFDFDEARGAVIWKARSKDMGYTRDAVNLFNDKYAFQPAGSLNKDYGFVRISLLGASYRAQDVAWVLQRGEIPEGMRVVHIIDDYTNNRACNLTLVSKKKDGSSQIKVTKKTLASDAGGDKLNIPLDILIDRMDKLNTKVDFILALLDKMTMPVSDNVKQSQRVKLLLSEFPGGSASRHELRDKWVAAGLRASSLPKAIMTAIDECLVSSISDGRLTVTGK